MVRFLLVVLHLLLGVMPAIAGANNSLLDISADGKRLLAANGDNGTVTVIDALQRKVLREIAVGGQPEGVTWIGAGDVAAATCYRDGQVVFFNTDSGAVLKKLIVAAEPYGIVADRAGKRLWVTHEYPGTISEIDAEKQEVIRTIKAGSFVRGLALRADERRLYVSEFYTSNLLAIDLESGRIVDQWPGQSTENLCRHVLVHPRRAKAYLPHIRSRVHIIDGSGSIFPHLSICDLQRGEDRRRASFAMDTFNGVYVVTNPWEAAMSPDGKRLYVVYAGTDDVNVCAVVDDDYREMAPLGRPVTVGRNPRAVRVSPDGGTVYIYNSLDQAVGVYSKDLHVQATIQVCAPARTAEWQRGKVLFNTALPPMTARRWVACSSCHPDGHHDGRVWQQPEGLRKTTALFGLAHTHPLHWSADRDETQDFEYTIRSQLMQGAGLYRGSLTPKRGFDKVELSMKLSGKSKDLDALASYSNSFEFPLSPHAPGGKLTAAAERGMEIFFRADVGCANCHSGPYFSDSSLANSKLHDVGTGSADESEKMGPRYDTPTLLGIYRTAPFLHHGKARTLHEVLTTFNRDDRHGKTSHLRTEAIDDLATFLQALPYEAPPTLTPNTVLPPKSQ